MGLCDNIQAVIFKQHDVRHFPDRRKNAHIFDPVVQPPVGGTIDRCGGGLQIRALRFRKSVLNLSSIVGLWKMAIDLSDSNR